MTSYIGCAENAFENTQHSAAHHGRRNDITSIIIIDRSGHVQLIILSTHESGSFPTSQHKNLRANHQQGALTPISIAAIIARVENHISLRHTAFIVMAPPTEKGSSQRQQVRATMLTMEIAGLHTTTFVVPNNCGYTMEMTRYGQTQ